ncbi:GapA-binding peptide SR1P [Paenibacillus sp. 481]|uniref:GapA-binding peptide SR1P n=1 Tax=Paenibacillus sp. 481 TaxID=2835869 RepID=UPI001E2F07C9|nr:GapA-binding peptide SR1P [Paenibacillus sp. 481]UHA72497.1 GapA-binding peptide SR1P [Paenibacillus sp. 481]
MNNSNQTINMGVIICKHCNSQVDTLDTNRTATIYGVCDQQECRQMHSSIASPIQAYTD